MLLFSVSLCLLDSLVSSAYKSQYAENDLGDLQHFLGITIERCGGVIILQRTMYAKDIVAGFNLLLSQGSVYAKLLRDHLINVYIISTKDNFLIRIYHYHIWLIQQVKISSPIFVLSP